MSNVYASVLNSETKLAVLSFSQSQQLIISKTINCVFIRVQQINILGNNNPR